jgi:hypothetical protein
MSAMNILDPDLETLHCKVCDQDWTRERKRGVKPSTCNDCKATAREAVEAAALAASAAVQSVSEEAVERIRAYKAWVKDDAMIWREFYAGEITREERIELSYRMPNYHLLPDSNTWKLAERLGLV